MNTTSVESESFLTMFNQWSDGQRHSILEHEYNNVFIPSTLDDLDGEQSQCEVLAQDVKRQLYSIPIHTMFHCMTLVQRVSYLFAAAVAPLVETFQAISGKSSASTLLKRIITLPIAVGGNLLKIPFNVIAMGLDFGRIISESVGMLAWHSGESLTKWIHGSSTTVLSDHPFWRDIVYKSIGETLLSAGALFIPIPAIQLLALPIICGSIYGTINNQFTIRECPEYYTMGHSYDGTNLRMHAIKTNNLLIKPVVTGCYATTMVTKFIGIALALVGTLPYAAATLPISYAAFMMAGACAVSLIAAHFFASSEKSSIEEILDEFSELVGIEWTDENREQCWPELLGSNNEKIQQRRKELRSNELEEFNRKLDRLHGQIETLFPDVPIKYLASWHANSRRNSIGYLTAGIGSIAFSVGTIFLRVFAL